MSTDPSHPPQRPAADSAAAEDDAEFEARQALEQLMVEARKLVLEMRRLLREQRRQRQH